MADATLNSSGPSKVSSLRKSHNYEEESFTEMKFATVVYALGATLLSCADANHKLVRSSQAKYGKELPRILEEPQM